MTMDTPTMDTGIRMGEGTANPYDGVSVQTYGAGSAGTAIDDRTPIYRYETEDPPPGDRYTWFGRSELTWDAIRHAGPEPFSWPRVRWFDDPTSLPLGTTPAPTSPGPPP